MLQLVPQALLRQMCGPIPLYINRAMFAMQHSDITQLLRESAYWERLRSQNEFWSTSFWFCTPTLWIWLMSSLGEIYEFRTLVINFDSFFPLPQLPTSNASATQVHSSNMSLIHPFLSVSHHHASPCHHYLSELCRAFPTGVLTWPISNRDTLNYLE